jgi:hypothetical protein
MRSRSGLLIIKNLELPVLYLYNGQIAVAAVHVGQLYFPQSPTNYNKEIKNALGEGYDGFRKTHSDIAQRMVNYITLNEFADLTVTLAIRGNEIALEYIKVFN